MLRYNTRLVYHLISSLLAEYFGRNKRDRENGDLFYYLRDYHAMRVRIYGFRSMAIAHPKGYTLKYRLVI